MKKLKMKELYNLNVEDLKYFEKQCLHELGKVDLEKTYLEKIETRTRYGRVTKYGTVFYFKTEEGAEIFALLGDNKKVTKIYISIYQNKKRIYGEIDSSIHEDKQIFNDIIWEQFADHFNLRIRLMFINETTPWKWDTKFTF